MSQRACTCGAADYNQQQQEQLTGGQQAQRRPPKPVVPAKNEVYVFIRASREHLEEMKNKMVLEQKIIENYRGTIIGLSEQVYVAESPDEQSPWSSPLSGDPRYCMLVLRFETMAEADRWSYSDRVFKQQDCLPPNDTIEGFIVPLKHLPPEDCHTFTMMNIRNVHDSHSFQNYYIDEVVQLFDNSNVEQGVVSTDDIQTLRRSWVKRGDFIFVHQTKHPEGLTSVFKSDAYCNLLEERAKWADVETLMFTVSRAPLKNLPKKR